VLEETSTLESSKETVDEEYQLVLEKHW